jgi:hypothetical protein
MNLSHGLESLALIEQKKAYPPINHEASDLGPFFA